MLRLSAKELGRVKRVNRFAGSAEIRRERSVGSLLESDRERNGRSSEIGEFRDNREVSTGGNGGDTLNIKEVDLFKAVDRWAGKECKKQGLVAEGSVKRRILGEQIVKGIRFPVMEEKEFASVVLKCDILSKKEISDLMRYFNSVLDTSVGFCETKRTGPLEKISRFGSLVTGWHYSSSCSEYLGLTVDKNIKLHAIRLFGSDSSEYSVTLYVYNCKTHSCRN